ncbi:hypothetical protein ACIHDR_43295 [Nocardia sp. NPDC052278]|uniref:hypothetical protein n=1 Tax=unclassified Nocardia TaxID=2637762 RepID=UPI0036B2D850
MAVTDVGTGLAYVRFDADHPLDLNDLRGFGFDYELLDLSTYTPRGDHRRPPVRNRLTR